MDGAPGADLRHCVGGPPWVFRSLVWGCGSGVGASAPAVSCGSPPMGTLLYVLSTRVICLPFASYLPFRHMVGLQCPEPPLNGKIVNI